MHVDDRIQESVRSAGLSGGIHVKITPGLHLLRCCSPAETHLTNTGFLKCRCFCLYRLYAGSLPYSLQNMNTVNIKWQPKLPPFNSLTQTSIEPYFDPEDAPFCLGSELCFVLSVVKFRLLETQYGR